MVGPRWSSIDGLGLFDGLRQFRTPPMAGGGTLLSSAGRFTRWWAPTNRGVQDDQVAGVPFGVVDHREDPALVLPPAVGRPHEDRFAHRAMGARVETG
jgi:hypothetical protein